MVVSRKLVESFAINLRLFSNKKSSIAEICRETKIHRQQFNKYLSGSSFPNAHNLSKICRYLGVSAETLFAAEGESITPAQTVSHSHRMQVDVQFGPDIPGKNYVTSSNDGNELRNKNQIKEGSYYCYFPFPGHEGFLLRTYLRIWSDDDRLYFSRVTRIRHPGDTGNLIARGHHTGNVIQSTDEITLVGKNRQTPHQISIINLERSSTFKGYYFGLALTRAAGNAMACRTAIEFLGKITPNRLMVQSLGIVQAVDESVPKQIRLALYQKANPSQNFLFPPSSAEIFSLLAEQSN